MITNLSTFVNSEFGEIRATEINGEPWFVGKDIAERLGYAKPENAIAAHVDEEDKTTTLIQGDGSNYKSKTTIINESGLYSLILGSKLPNAKKFKHWVTSEVIPSVIKHGAYLTPETLEKTIQDPDFIIGVLNNLKAEQERRRLAEKVVVEQQQKLIEERPKVIFADAVSASDSAILVRDLAKMIRQNGVSIGEKRLWAWLRENGYICKGSCLPTQKAMEMRLFVIVERTIERGDGKPIVKATTKITGKGQQYFVNRFLKGASND